MNHKADQAVPHIKSVLTECRPLYCLTRKTVPEVVVHGIGFCKVQNQPLTGDDPETTIIMRSLLKPWQFLASDVGDMESYWALGLSSHSGQNIHMEQLHQLSEIAVAGEDELFCPRGYPLDSIISSRLKIEGKQPSRFHHPCAGKHLVMIAGCRKHDYPVAAYWDVGHPIQKRVYNLIGQLAGEKPIWLTDSCGLPTVALTARATLSMWEKLVCNDDHDYVRLRTLWLNNIRLVGGAGRLESDLMEIQPGHIIAKEGADGLLVVASLPTENEPAAVCLVKVASGFNSSHLALGLLATLSEQKELTPVFKQILSYLKSRVERWIPQDQSLSFCGHA